MMVSVTDLPTFVTTQLPGLQCCLYTGTTARTPNWLFTKHAGRSLREKAANIASVLQPSRSLTLAHPFSASSFRTLCLLTLVTLSLIQMALPTVNQWSVHSIAFRIHNPLNSIHLLVCSVQRRL